MRRCFAQWQYLGREKTGAGTLPRHIATRYKDAMPSAAARVGVILPLYRSAATLRACLESLAAQSYRDFLVQMVDSSPDEACAEIARRFPRFSYWRAPGRMWPQEARNEGARRCAVPLLVFTDPDCYAAPDWLDRLVAAHDASGEPVVGALACHGRRWLDRGLHLTKFSKWLPGRPVRAVDMGPTANLLCPRTLYDAIGGFAGDMLMGDTTFSWDLRRRGHELRFAPDAVVAHHHLDSFGAFLRERRRRGQLYGALRSDWQGGGRLRALGFFLATALPLRLLTNLAHTARHALEAGWAGDALRTAPLVLAGHGAALLGEAVAYGRAVLAPPRSRPAARPLRRATPPPRTG